MGLFNRRKPPEPAQPIHPGESEFDRDVRALLAQDNIQCREDVCEAEYKKALGLLENPTQDKLRRAYDLMGNLAAQFSYAPAMLWLGDFCENVLQKDGQAAVWYQRAADQGDGQGARCYADMLMAGKGVDRNMQLAMKYYAKAADKGVPEAAFVMGEYFRNAGNTDMAVKAYQAALRGGYAPAKLRLDQLSSPRR